MTQQGPLKLIDPTGTVTSITGVAPVTANGVSGVSETGDVNVGLTTPLAIAYGGTALSTTPTNGQLLIGNGTNYTLSTLTAGSGITITNGAGSITLAADGGAVVTSITATAPIVASASTGTVNISLTTPLNVIYGGTGTSTQFTAGSIVFAGVSGVYTQDNANLFWDDSNNLLGIGSNTPSSGTASRVRIDNTSSSIRTALNVTGTWTTGIGAPRGVHVDANYTPSAGATCYGVDSDVNFAAPIASTVTGICFQASPSFSGNAGTVNCYGYFYDGGAGLTGTVDFQWGGYFSNPAAGTTKVALYAANMAIGSYSAVTPPSNGLIVSGSVSIGSSSATASALLSVTSTTQGFLPPVMTTTQRNAIGTPATGLTIYNTSNLDLETYNGTSWIGATASGVTSITGTANQISASASTGAVTLSFTNGISIGSYQATASPTGGLIMPGKLGIGTNAPNASDYITISPSLTASGNAAYILRLTGITLTAAASNDEFNMIRVGSATLATTTGSFTGLTFYGFRLFGPSKTGNGTFSNAYGYYVGAIATIATNQYAGYFTTPTGGTVNTAVYGDNLAVGYTTPSPPSLGAIVSGAVGIGTSGPVNKLDISGAVAIGTYAGVNTAPSNGLIVSGQTLFKTSSNFVGGSVEIGGSDRISFALGGSKTSTDGSTQYGLFLNPTFAPTSTTTQVAQIVSYLQASPPVGVNIGTAYNILLQSGGQGGVGTVTNGYNLYVSNPSFGTNKTALYSDNASINYSTATTTESLSVKGQSGGGIANFYNETANAGVIVSQTSNSSGINGPVLALRHTRGSIASPTATQVNDILGAVDFGGYTNALYNPGAVIFGVAAETWTSTAAGSDIYFYTTPKTTTSNAETLRLSANGNVVCGGSNGAAIATNATDGFFYIPSCAGTPTGVPTTFTGRNAMVYDTSANKLWIYNGSWRGVVVT